MYETAKTETDCFSEKYRRKLSFDELSGSKRKLTSICESKFDTSETVSSSKVEEIKLPTNTGISIGVPGSSVANSTTTISANTSIPGKHFTICTALFDFILIPQNFQKRGLFNLKIHRQM